MGIPLLSIATHHALMKYAGLVPSDELDPTAILALIPLRASQHSLTVVRLEQEDSVVYGRTGEERPALQDLVVQLVVAEDVIVCTGVGRRSKEVKLPCYERARTVLILRSVARIAQVMSDMINDTDDTSWVPREGSIPSVTIAWSISTVTAQASSDKKRNE
ncbi:hypothetical protein AZE42_07060 [Rhizopogon vesiculosus]|uniref:Uncharacterized protein n=1 Tax=Rhizopogon vesiculosus TaxID=180088 RepID=A0A1J8QZS8_9AGAM|nr:hypothetical protein AZE42_07060 [Rhizopogon vesiculosus]